MKAFLDTRDRSWELAINVATIKRVRDLTKIDLPNLFDNKLAGLSELIGNPVELVNVLWVLISRQAESLKVSDEDFGGAMGGDCLEKASEAFLQELADFFPRARREAIHKLLAKTKEVGAKMQARGLEQLDQVLAMNSDEIVNDLQSHLASKSTP